MYKMLSIETIKLLFLIGYMFCLSIVDIKYKSISVYSIIFGYFIAITMYIFSPFNFESLVIGITVGILIVLISLFSKQKVGIGDALVIMLMGIFFGMEVLNIIIYGLIILVMSIIILKILKKSLAGKEIPFIPFVLAGILVNILSL